MHLCTVRHSDQASAKRARHRGKMIRMLSLFLCALPLCAAGMQIVS